MTTVKGSEQITAVFGAWPSFHDAEVLSVVLNRSDAERQEPFLDSTLHTFTVTGEVDAEGKYVLANHVLVTFRFYAITDLSLDGFNHQNVLWGLTIDPCDPKLENVNYAIRFGGCYGLDATFNCVDLEVISVRACDENGVALQ